MQIPFQTKKGHWAPLPCGVWVYSWILGFISFIPCLSFIDFHACVVCYNCHVWRLSIPVQSFECRKPVRAGPRWLLWAARLGIAGRLYQIMCQHFSGSSPRMITWNCDCLSTAGRGNDVAILEHSHTIGLKGVLCQWERLMPIETLKKCNKNVHVYLKLVHFDGGQNRKGRVASLPSASCLLRPRYIWAVIVTTVLHFSRKVLKLKSFKNTNGLQLPFLIGGLWINCSYVWSWLYPLNWIWL